MIAGENLYAGDYVYVDQRDQLLYQATWDEFKKGNAWRISVDVKKGEAIPKVLNIVYCEVYEAAG